MRFRTLRALWPSTCPSGYADTRVSGIGVTQLDVLDVSDEFDEFDMKRNPTDAELKEASRVFKALSHPDRLRLTCLLAEREGATQHDLVEELGWPQSTVARHLGMLRDRGLVVGERRGPEVVLEATAMPRLLLDTVCEWMHPEEANGNGHEAGNGAANGNGVLAGSEDQR